MSRMYKNTSPFRQEGADVERAAPSVPEGGIAAFRQVSTISGLSVLPLRLFLGVTFTYAGIQKILDPGFFHLGSGTYIGTQLLGFSRGSPINFILRHMLEHAVAFGWLTIITEIIVGVLTLLGLFSRAAAVTGMIVSLTLFLSASWHVYPYFLGSDIVFVVAWGTLAITGPGGLCLDAGLGHLVGARLTPISRWALTGPFPLGNANGPAAASAEPPRQRATLITRAEALVGAAAAIGVMVLGLLPRGGPSGQVAAGAPSSTGAGATSGGTSSTPSTIPSGAKKIGNVSQLPVNSAGAVTDPKSDDPALIIHLQGKDFRAFDAVCTHAGCTVQYDPQSKLMVCPCHGAAYDPAQDAQVVAGPAPAPLTKLEMGIDKNGNIYLV